MNNALGPAGRIAKSFLQSELTPLLTLVGFLLGVFAVLVTPREEEPQINVTFANVFIAYPGASVKEVEELISTPAEQILSEIEGLEHVYSVSSPGMAVLTVQFKVGQDRTQALVRLYNALYSKQDWLPSNLGVSAPIIKPKGIDDVPIVTLTLWSDDPHRGADELQNVAHAIEVELKRVAGTRDIYTVGGPGDVVHVEFDPALLAGHDLDLDDLRRALQTSNSAHPPGSVVKDNREILIQPGQFLSTAEEVANLVVGVHNGKPVYLSEVAQVRRAAAYPSHYVWTSNSATGQPQPAVTIAIAKQPGSNAVQIANTIIARVGALKGVFIPDNVHVTVTRNYGETADAKAKQLIKKLIFATAAVVLLVIIALGKREALVVGVAVIVTLAITLFASWAWGFTINRVSLFALIFSIGILVDDAIVVVENIHRHLQIGQQSLLESIPRAVDEVGGPTILATLTVIAALLPMAFVSGLMGPYMSPIPINASIGMIISLVIAFVVTPWLANRILAHGPTTGHNTGLQGVFSDEKLYAVFVKYIKPFLQGASGAKRRTRLLYTVLGLIVASVSLVVFKLVILKMLPFDNKSEFQVIVDMPAGTSLEQTARVLRALGAEIAKVPEVTNYQAYAGSAAPINFNGLVRQYYLRTGPNVGDLQVNLVDKSLRQRKSHEIAASVRAALQTIGRAYNANVKIVEVPPGPPVMSPLVAEVYGLEYAGQRQLAGQIRRVFETTPDIVDVDDSMQAPQARLLLTVDQHKAALWGIAPQRIVQALGTALSGDDVSYLHPGDMKYPVPIRLELPLAQQTSESNLLQLQLRDTQGRLLPISDLVRTQQSVNEQPIYHKDLLPVVFVTGEMAGKIDSPLYGMFAVNSKLASITTAQHLPLQRNFIHAPDNPYLYSIKWDGEWQVTYETFRDMGIAYAVGLLLIYFLVVAQFRSYMVPLIIMGPIPLTIIGILPGHALTGATFTATSMIGMIALAGIIVRNSILLVDFINQQRRDGVDLQEAVLRAGAVRAKPIILTGLAAMLGAFFILDDPIFNGLAVALIFGILVSTLLTLVIIPVWYYAYLARREAD
ncbi:MAG: efflux RND transporter permease subunit [Gammaproteobacteria bacterium]|nr:efflux RND transporter permease subunit [Gammaproteobacteria bacterium]